MTEKITVRASKEYDVIVGKNILKDFPAFLSKIKPFRKIMIVTDDNVAELYLGEFCGMLSNAGFLTFSFVLKHGEKNKNFSSVEKIIDSLAEKNFEKSDLILALGGGIVGDVGGFAASCYLRGIRYIQIPTTLLACVDSSVGGKTAVNLTYGKNLAGHFYQPEMTFCDTDFLKSLSNKEFSQGVSEIIKYGMIFDSDIFFDLKKAGSRGKLKNSDILIKIITKCVEFKAETVEKDEFDTGLRHLLNFGHTVGHGIEKASGFKIPHGSAVAMGMAVITKASEKDGICEKGTYDELVKILKKYCLPYSTDIPYEKIAEASSRDKKIEEGLLKVILPEKIGKCFIKSIDFKEFSEILKKGLGE